MLDLLVIILIIILGFSVKNWVGAPFGNYDTKVLNQLWAYHLLFGILYWFYVAYGPGGDAMGYWRAGSNLNWNEALALFSIYGPGTYGMYVISHLPSGILGLSFFTVSILFTLLGYIGMVFFYSLFVKYIKLNSSIGKYSLFPLIFFLPNFHFWSAGLGKDTLCFMCIALFIYGMQQPAKNMIKIALAIGLTYMVRPHISVFLVAAFGMAFMLDGNLKVYQKVLFSAIFLVAFIILFDKFMSFLKVEELSAESISQYSATSTSNLSRSSGSGVDISSYPYPLKVLTFLYRPLFFDINGVLAVVASFENLLLLILSIKFVKINPIKLFQKGNIIFKGCLIFFVTGALTFSLILGNLGIMLREKNMFTPCLLFVCLWGLSYAQEQQRAKVEIQSS